MVLVNGIEAWLETPAGRFALSAQRYTPDVVWPDGQRADRRLRAEPWPQLDVPRRGRHRGQPGGGRLPRARPGGRCAGASAGGAPGPRAARRASARCSPGATIMRCTTRTRRSTSMPRSPARGAWRPYAGVPRDLGASRRPLPPRAHLVSQLPVRRRARARPRLHRGPGLARHVRLGPRPAATRPCSSPRARPARRPPDAAYALAGARARSARRSRFASPLERAADAYVVRRGAGKTIVAGYPWFTDWGRDTFIALRGFMGVAGRARARAGNPARLGAGGLRGHGAQPLPGRRRGSPSTMRSTPRSGT